MVYASFLRHQGHHVFEASDGEETLALVRSCRPDLLLLDIWMPKRNGLEVLDALRFDPAAAQMRVAMVSVLNDSDVQLEAFGGGAVEYMVKGLSLADFLARVEAILAGDGSVAQADSCDTAGPAGRFS